MVYAVVAALFVSGAAWLVADALKDGPSGEAWQAIGANLLMIHGGAGMAMLMAFGALFPLHVRRAWRAGKNRLSGGTMVTVNGLLILTAFGLYYSGSELMRPWISDAHTAAGFALAGLMFVHVLLGRRTAGKHQIANSPPYNKSKLVRPAATQPPWRLRSPRGRESFAESRTPQIADGQDRAACALPPADARPEMPQTESMPQMQHDLPRPCGLHRGYGLLPPVL
jgi:hypothetical protein